MTAEEPPFQVAFVPGVTVSRWARVWPERRPSVPLALLPIGEGAQEETLRHGVADMAFVRLPVDSDGLNVIPLYDEAAFVVVPRDHPIALFDEVGTADLAGEELLTDAAEDAIALVAAGAGVAVLPQSIVRLHGRKDVVARPVTDAPTTSIGLAWLATRQEDDRIAEFIGIVRGRTARSSRGTDAGDHGQPASGKGAAPVGKQPDSRKGAAPAGKQQRPRTKRPPESGGQRRRAR